MNNKISRESYIVIQGWMVTDLKLKGIELIVYACIYGFSQAESQTFKGSLQYLADWTNSSKQGVLNALKALVDKELIAKKDIIINGVKFVEYYTTEFNGVLNKVERGIQESLPNNIEYNLEYNINNINKRKNIKKESKTPESQNGVAVLFTESKKITPYPLKENNDVSDRVF